MGIGKRVLVRLGWGIGAGGLALFVFVLSFYLAVRVEMRSSQVQVPDLTGLTQEEAAQAARPADLVLDVVAQRNDPAVPSGRILQQEPPAGASVRRGRKVKVVVSLGGKVLEVPNLMGDGARAAEIELRQAGFAPGSEARVFSVEVPPGSVLAKVPPPGSPAVPGTRVHRLVSEGPLPPQWIMADLAGRSQSAAEKWIDLCGFRRGPVRVVVASDQAPGTVVGQLPPAGYPIPRRGVVELTVAR